jgi:Ethylbenzene dehydrogenase
MRLRLALGLLVLMTLAASPALAQAPLVAVRVPGAGPILDPFAPVWKNARPVTVPMLPQTVALPHKPDAAVKALVVRALYNDGWIALLIEWRDPTRSDTVILDNFGDQVAVQLPIDAKAATPPSPMMGNPGGRVTIMQWRAAFQRDIDDHPPTIRDLYPNAWTDPIRTRSWGRPTRVRTPGPSVWRIRSPADAPPPSSTRWRRAGAR